jgi:hypothetical protein
LANKDKKLYAATPEAFTQGSLKNLNAGRVCGIVGLCLSALYVLYVIFILAVFGTAILSDPSRLFEQWR